MKFVVIFAIIVLFVRIDFLFSLFEKTMIRLTPVTAPEIEAADIAPKDLISVSEDKNLSQTPREDFLALLAVFRSSPDSTIRQKAFSVFKDHPTMFSAKLDRELEAHIFRWRELLINNEPEVVNFLLDLLLVLKGENREMVNRFFALWMEIDMRNFLSAYVRTKDSNCRIGALFGDSIPEGEKINEYYERQKSLQTILREEKIDPEHRALATNCLLVLGIEIAKVNPDPVVPVPEAPSEEP